jgi:CxxC motif-containing protein (DUF1111 family)
MILSRVKNRVMSMIRLAQIIVLPLILLAGSACSDAPAEPSGPPTAYGDPLPDLTPAERTRFEAGLNAFGHVFLPAEGLGPFFNENQCSACHTFPASGGTGEQSIVRLSRFQAPDRCDLLTAVGGENVQRNTTPLLRDAGVARRPEPEGTERALIRVPFLFGLGLIEAIDDETLLQRADPDDRDNDGISGRPGRDASGRLARFGRKAEHASIAAFAAGALFNEMGLTSSVYPAEPLLDGQPMPSKYDPATDPEISDAMLSELTDFVRFLAPPPGQSPTDAATRDLIRQGAALFDQIGCSICHTPEMTTARNDVRALSQRKVRLYSDLLLHDMGPDLAGFCGVGATPAEWRTEPLMGVGQRDRLLHDGRAYDLFAAIRAHGGEATKARASFDALDRVTQEALIQFLRSL